MTELKKTHAGDGERNDTPPVPEQGGNTLSSNGKEQCKDRQPKIIDCFLFFQELDLLEIRLKYLNEVVDTFVIVEACQTFTGKPKEFAFELNQDRYSEYLSKINYFRIEDKHSNYASVVEHLSRLDAKSAAKVKSWMDNHNHYDKDKLECVLDTYHRECIQVALEGLGLNDSDVVMISDLDEIPSLIAIQASITSTESNKPSALKQKTFSYFLDYYKDSDWIGTIIGSYGDIKRYSLNDLRIDSKKTRRLINDKAIEKGGYHFTTCGSIEEIKKKIESWAHQEFNNSFVINSLEDKIKRGQDPFSRSSGTIFSRVRISDINIYDKHMQEIIAEFPHLLSPGDIEKVSSSIISDLINKIRLYLPRIKDGLSRKIRRAVGKIKP